MFTFLCIGDPHYTKKNIQFVEELEKKTIETIKKSEPDFVVIMGDTLDGHGNIKCDLQIRAFEFFKKIVNTGTPLFVLIGNHDYINNKQYLTKYHCFNLIRDRKDMYIIDEPKSFKIKGKRIVMLPYVPNKKMRKALLNLKSNFLDGDTAIVFCHQEIKGCRTETFVSTEGDKWGKDLPFLISGHIHKHQIIDNIFYTGTPYQTNMGEDNVKGIYMFGVNTIEKLKNYKTLKHNNISYNYEKIKLDIKTKKTLEVELDQLDQYEIPENNDYIFKLKILYKDFNKMKSEKKSIVKKYKDKVERIGWKYIGKKKQYIKKKDSNYFNILKNKLKSDYQTKLYDDICRTL